MSKRLKLKLIFGQKKNLKLLFPKYILVITLNFQFIIIWILFMTGMRIGEASALQWDDVDFEEGTLNIPKLFIIRMLLIIVLQNLKQKQAFVLLL